MNRYYLTWRGRRLGPFSVHEIEQKLSENEIGRFHLVGDEQSEMTVGDLLAQVEKERTAEQLRRQARDRAAREAKRQEEVDEAQAQREIVAERDRLTSELDELKNAGKNLPIQPLQFGAPQIPYIPSRTSGQAITAFVFALFNFVPGVNFVSWLIALILAYSALADMRRDPHLGGRGLALAALWITYILLVLGVLAGILILLGTPK
jgi:hypothetical protein